MSRILLFIAALVALCWMGVLVINTDGVRKGIGWVKTVPERLAPQEESAPPRMIGGERETSSPRQGVDDRAVEPRPERRETNHGDAVLQTAPDETVSPTAERLDWTGRGESIPRRDDQADGGSGGRTAPGSSGEGSQGRTAAEVLADVNELLNR